MTSIILTTDISHNHDGDGGNVKVTVTETLSDGTQNTDIRYVGEGVWSNTLTGFHGQDTTNEYHVRFDLDNDGDYTDSPTVHQATLDVPEVSYDLAATPPSTTTSVLSATVTSESTDVLTPTDVTATPQTTTEQSHTTVGTSPTSVDASPSTVTQTFSDVVLGTSPTSSTATTQTEEFAEHTVTANTTSVEATTNTTYSWVEITRSTGTTNVSAIPTTVSTVYNETSAYEQRIGANIDHVEDSWSNNGVEFGEGQNIYALSNALTGILDGFDFRVNLAHTNIHVPNATGKSLDRLGNLANVRRKSGEPDDRYRQRIIAAIRASITGTTYDEVAEFTALVLNRDVHNVTFDLRPTQYPATLFVLVDDGDMANTPFTATEVANLLDRVVPADHDVVLEQQGTFRFKSVGGTDDPDLGFTTHPADESVGGTLKGEIGQ